MNDTLRTEFGHAIFEQCVKSLNWQLYKRVHLFLPIQRQHEIDTWPLAKWLWAAHPEIEVFVPRIEGGEMVHIQTNARTHFETGVFGAPDPASGKKAVAGTKFDLILVPLLAFDLHGNRVGYGAGFYDRFLATQGASEIAGLAYDNAKIDAGIEIEKQDVPLHAVITERGRYDF